MKERGATHVCPLGRYLADKRKEWDGGGGSGAAERKTGGAWRRTSGYILKRHRQEGWEERLDTDGKEKKIMKQITQLEEGGSVLSLSCLPPWWSSAGRGRRIKAHEG